MGTLMKVLFLLKLFSFTCGKHLSKQSHQERKWYARQMIIPNKFIPMLKESALYKSRQSSNDLSDFLQHKSHEHDTVTGQTRQNLMSSMGMDPGQSQGMDGGGTNGMGLTGGMGGMGDNGGMGGMGLNGGMGGIGGTEGIGGTQGMAGNGAIGGIDPGGIGGDVRMGGMSDQMNALNGMGGMGNSDSSANPLEGNMGGNGMNSLSNGGLEGMINSDSNSAPAGDPMGSLKDMLSTQGTNAALGTNSEAFGPGGSANSNIISMLNEIVGKEMPGESPVDPSSRSEQVWDQMQKSFESQKPSGVPYIDEPETRGTTQNDKPGAFPANSSQTSTKGNQSISNSSMNASSDSSKNKIATEKPSVPNPAKTANVNTNSSISNPASSHSNPSSGQAMNPPSATNLGNKPNVQKEGSRKALVKTTGNFAGMDSDEDEPITTDMIKFLRGVKFVVSQEPGNDIILGKKFTSDTPYSRSDLKEENGVMKNKVFAKKKEKDSMEERKLKFNGVKTENFKKQQANITLLVKAFFAKKKDFEKYIKAAKVLARASQKLKDPVAKKSTEIAIASIMKVVALGGNEKKSSSSTTLLNGGDVKNKLTEKYVEAARVLGTAARKLLDPVAKESTEIGISSIIKVIALGQYPTSKKTFVPDSHRLHIFDEDFNGGNSTIRKQYEKIGSSLAEAVNKALNSPENKNVL